MQSFLKEVGRGKKGAKDLPFELAREAAALVYEGKASDAQIGAYLMAERMKSETVDELLAFVEEARTRTVQVAHGAQGVLDCAGAYDGRGKSFAATIPVAAVLASLGVPVVLHGSHTLPPKFGVTLYEVLQELNVPIEETAETAAGRLESVKAVFLHTEAFCPPLKRLRPIREDLGVRTLLNYAEKFLNPTGADYLIAGVFHTSAMEKAVELMLRLGYRKGMVVQGVDGSEDVPVNRPFACCVIREGTYEKHLIDPKEYGVYAEMETIRLSPQEQAAGVVGVLREAEHPLRNVVLLNAAVRLWLTEKVSDVAAGIELARTALDEGRAWDVLQQWRNGLN